MASSSELKDKATTLIGQYLLQGYCMLATHCPECGTVLLRKKDNTETCVLCNEILPQSTTHAGKDNNGENTTASDEGTQSNNSIICSTSPVKEMSPLLTSSLAQTRQVLLDKISTASHQLQHSRSVQYDIELCHLIKACIETLKSLNELSTK